MDTFTLRALVKSFTGGQEFELTATGDPRTILFSGDKNEFEANIEQMDKYLDDEVQFVFTSTYGDAYIYVEIFHDSTWDDIPIED